MSSPKKGKQSGTSDDTVELVAGASQLVVLVFGVVGALVTVLEWPLERKIVFLIAFFFLWLTLKIFTWRQNRRKKSSARKKLPRLLNLYVSVQHRLHPEFKNILLKAMILRMIDLALIMILIALMIATMLSVIEGAVGGVLDRLTPSPTLTETIPPTLTSANTLPPTFTFTSPPSLTPTSLAEDYYYMIVLDASASMNETFDGRSRWDAAQDSLRVILEVLDTRSNYGLIVIGGSDKNEVNDPCASRIEENVQFTSKDQLNSNIEQLQPGGGGSYSAAFNLAVAKLRQQPDHVLKKLYFITGPSDDCGSDEWVDIETASIEIPDDLYGGIIIMDEESGYRPIEFARRMQERFENINVQVPNTNHALQAASAETIKETIVIIEKHATAVAPTPQTPTRTSSPTRTPSPGPTQTPANTMTVFPIFTLTSSPTKTFTPTASKTSTPSKTPTTASVCQSTRPYLNTASYGGTVTVDSPADCSTGYAPASGVVTSGPYANLPGGTVIWVFVYPPNNLYYPQSPDACASPAQPPDQSGGSWNVPSYLGQESDYLTSFDIVVALVDQTASDFFSNHVHNGCLSGNYTGIPASTLKNYNITEKDFVTIQTSANQ